MKILKETVQEDGSVVFDIDLSKEEEALIAKAFPDMALDEAIFHLINDYVESTAKDDDSK